MEKFLETLKQHIAEHPPNFGDGESVLTMLYECHNENNPYDNEQIRTDFNELYQQMNGMPLREIDNIIYPVCKLCRDHERAGFMEGVKVGIRLEQELFGFVADTNPFGDACLVSGAEIGYKPESPFFTPGCCGFYACETTTFWGEISPYLEADFPSPEA